MAFLMIYLGVGFVVDDDDDVGGRFKAETI
jgi:hypothetical protein